MIPVLFYSLGKELLWFSEGARRPLLRSTWLALFGFICGWKGGLMLEHDKVREGVAWVMLTGLVWGLIVCAQRLPRGLYQVSRQRALELFLTIVAAFFLVMAVVDSVIQLVVLDLEWSRGLGVELGFFLPMGLALLLVSRWLRIRESH